MPYDPERHHRRSIRLPCYDYAQAGAYFVTVCTGDHRCLFGEVEGEEMRLSHLGEIADECWRAIPMYFADVELDAFVVMPNHIHRIIWIMDTPVGATHASPPWHAGEPMDAGAAGIAHGPKRRSIGAIVGSYKAAVSRRIREIAGMPGPPVWRRNYFEHVIRNDTALNRIRQYIANNPLRWAYDCHNPLAANPEAEDAWGE